MLIRQKASASNPFILLNHVEKKMAVIRDSKGQALLLIAIVFVVFMDGLDASIVNIALPYITSSFAIDAGTAVWITMVYFMMMASLLLIFGKLADRGIIKKILVAGLIIFSLFSLSCGLSNSFETLLISRIFQGIGAAIMGACSPLLCVRFLPENRLGIGLGVIAAGASIGYASGPALGGILTEFLSWHWIFLINVPIGVAGIAFLLRALPKDEGYVRSYFDVPGSILLVTATITGIFALERSTHLGLENIQIISAVTICIVSVILFIIWEGRCEAPLLNLSIFRSSKFSPVFIAYFLINLVGTGKWYLIPFYLALIMGFDSATSGMYMFIQAAITVIISVPIGRWSDHVGRRWFSVVSCLAMAISCAILIFIDPSMGLQPLITVAILSGILWGFSGPAAGRIVEHVQEGEEGTGAALIAVSGYFGAAVGAALFAALFSFISDSGNVPFTDLDPGTFMLGFHGVMLVGLVMAIVAVVLSAAVKDKRPPESSMVLAQ